MTLMKTEDQGLLSVYFTQNATWVDLSPYFLKHLPLSSMCVQTLKPKIYTDVA